VLRGGELYDMMNMPVGRTAGKLEINFTPLYIVFDGAAPAAVLNALRDAVGRK